MTAAQPGERRIAPSGFARLLGDWRPADGRQLASALGERIRLLVLDGRLALQTRVPAERELAGALGVSRTTVAAAYDSLRATGYLHSRRGAGSWTRLPGAANTEHTPFSPGYTTALADLAYAAAGAPCDSMRRAAAAAVGDLDAHIGGHGYSPYGLPVLREAVARRFTERGLPTGPEQILITVGGMQAIALAMTLLVAPGDRVLVEHPTYPNALDVVRARTARPVPVPLVEGPAGVPAWDLELLAAAIRDTAPAVAYLVPDFHNPTGAVLDPAGRAALGDLARRTRTPLLVDETMTDLALDVPLPVPVAAHGVADSPLVLTIGSASKVFWGGLRVGWLRGTPGMIRRLAALRPSVDLGGAVLDQLVTARLLGEFEQVAAERRTDLRIARDGLRSRLAELLPGWRPNRPPGGLSLWVDLGSPVSSLLAGAARRQGVLLAPGPLFGIDGAFERYLRLPYTLRPEQRDSALDRLALAWRRLGEGGRLLAGTHPAGVPGRGEPEPVGVA